MLGYRLIRSVGMCTSILFPHQGLCMPRALVCYPVYAIANELLCLSDPVDIAGIWLAVVAFQRTFPYFAQIRWKH